MSDTGDHVVFAALASVCTVLLGAAGMSTKQLAALVSSLQAQLAARDRDVAALNTALLLASREAGQADHLQLQVDNLESDNAALEEQIETAIAERDEAKSELARVLKLYRQATTPEPDDGSETLGNEE